MNIIVDRANGLLHVNLSGFKSTVNVNNYNVFLYSSGVKPSKNVNLSCLWAIPSGNYGKQATWTTGAQSSSPVDCPTAIGACTRRLRCRYQRA